MLTRIVAIAGIGGFAYICLRQLLARWPGDVVTELGRDLIDVVLPQRPMSRRAIERRVHRAMIANVTVSVTGRTRVPAHFEISVSRADWEQLASAVDILEQDLGELMLEKGFKNGWEVPEEVSVTISVDDRRRNGWPHVAVASRAPDYGTAQPEKEYDEMARTVVVPAPEQRRSAPIDNGSGDSSDHTTAIPQVVLVSLDAGRWGSISASPSQGVVEIGRLHQADLGGELVVSATHCRLEARDDGWAVIDAGSRNGTYVDGAAVREHLLQPGEVVQLATNGPRYRFSFAEPTIVRRSA